MELELGLGLGLGLPCGATTEADDLKGEATCSNGKRRYDEAFEKTTLPLLDGCDDDHSDGQVADSSCSDDCKQVFCHSWYI
jgi:hypothetical protein